MASATCCTTTVARPRERIVTTARDLFHKFGIHNIGVEAIAEAAGTNKMTLYRHFGSKDDLILECLHEIADEVEQMWRDLAMTHPGDPMAQVIGWLHEAADCVVEDDRGCDFCNAAVELTAEDHPARRFIEDFKRRFRDHLAQLCRDAGIAQGDLLADTLCILFEGARVSRQSCGAEGPSARFIRMGEAVIATFRAA